MSNFRLCSKIRYGESPLWDLGVSRSTRIVSRNLAIRLDSPGVTSQLQELHIDEGDDLVDALINDKQPHYLCGEKFIMGLPNKALQLKSATRLVVEWPATGDVVPLVGGSLKVRVNSIELTRLFSNLAPLAPKDGNKTELILILRSDGVEFITNRIGGIGNKRVLLTVTGNDDLVLRPLDSIDTSWEKIHELDRVALTCEWLTWSWLGRPTLEQIAWPVELTGKKLEVAADTFDLPPELLKLQLRDQPPGSAMIALSRMDLAVGRLRIEYDAAYRVTCVEASFGKVTAKGTTLEYTCDREGGERSDRLEVRANRWRATSASLQRIRALRANDGARRGFMPIDQGWLQIDLPDRDHDPKSRISTARADGDPEIVSTVREGAWRVGTRRPERETSDDAASSLPWSLEVDRVGAFVAKFNIDVNATWTLKSATVTLNNVAARLRGLLWLGVGRDGDDDLLPRLELDSGMLRDLILVSEDTQSSSDGWSIQLSDGKAPAPVVITTKDGWPEVTWQTAQLTLPQDASVVVWLRHPRLPAIQAMPLTAPDEAATVPLASRELLPMRLPESPLQLSGSGEGWPMLVHNEALGEFWWPEWSDAPKKVTPKIAAWQRDAPSLSEGFPWMSLSIPGVEFWPAGKIMATPRASYRLDLPYADELHARATPTRTKGDEAKTKDDEAQEQVPGTPDIALRDDAAVRSAWLGRHDAWMLSLGEGTVLLTRADAPTVDPQVLLPGWSWKGSMVVDDSIDVPARRFGHVEVDKRKLQADDALRGPSAQVVLKNDRTITLDFDATTPPTMMGWALPMLRQPTPLDGKFPEWLDGAGLSHSRPRSVGKSLQVQTVRCPRLPTSAPWDRITLLEARPLPMDGDTLLFGCRDLPCRRGVERWTYTHQPWSGPLADFAWSLHSRSGAPIHIGGFVVTPTLLRSVVLDDTDLKIEFAANIEPIEKQQRDLGKGEAVLELVSNGVSVDLRVVESTGFLWRLPALNPTATAGSTRCDRDPWLQARVGVAPGKHVLTLLECHLHLPVLGHWQQVEVLFNPDTRTFNLEAPGIVKDDPDRPCMQLKSLELVIGKQATLQLGVHVDLGVVAFEIGHDTTGHSSVVLLRAPGLVNLAVKSLQVSPGFHALMDSGMAVVFAPFVGPDLGMAVLPGWSICQSRNALAVGVAFGSGSKGLVVRCALVEGEVTVRAIDEAIVDQIAYHSEFDGEVDDLASRLRHELRLVGNWKVQSLIRWPGFTLKDDDLMPNETDESVHVMEMQWEGQRLVVTNLRSRDEGTLLFSMKRGEPPPVVRTTHCFTRTRDEAKWKFHGLHACEIGPPAVVAKLLGDRGDKLVGELSKGSSEPAHEVLEGFLGPKDKSFRAALEKIGRSDLGEETLMILVSTLFAADYGHQRLLPISTPLLAWPGVDELGAKELSTASFPSFTKLKDNEKADLALLPVDPVRKSVLSFPIDQLRPGETYPGMQIVPNWMLGASSRAPNFDLDARVWVTQDQQKHRPHGFLRSQFAVSRLFDDKPMSTLAVTERSDSTDSGWLVFDAAKIIFTRPVRSVFAASESISELAVGGERGLSIVRDGGTVAYQENPRMLMQQAAIAVGRPGFALRRTFASSDTTSGSVEALPSICEVPGAPKMLRAHVVRQEPEAACATDHGLVVWPEALAQGIHYVDYRPVTLAVQATTGTRHWSEGPMVADAAADAMRWRVIQEHVDFAAPRTPGVQRATTQARWPARQRLRDPEESLDAIQSVLSPLTETISVSKRSGVKRTRREALLQSRKMSAGGLDGNVVLADSMPSLSQSFRAPRPEPLPRDRQTRGLPTLDVNGRKIKIMPSKRVLEVYRGIMDVIFRRGSSSADARPFAVATLKHPAYGLLRKGWNGDFMIRIECADQVFKDELKTGMLVAWLHLGQRSMPLQVRVDPQVDKTKTGFDVMLSLADGLIEVAEDVDQSGELHLLVSTDLNSAIAKPANQLALREPSYTLVLPIHQRGARNHALPMRPLTVWFEDPVYNDTLASEVAAAIGADAAWAIRSDRRAYNASGMLSFLIEAPPGADVLVRWVRQRVDDVTGAIGVAEMTLGQDATEVRSGVYKIDIADLRVAPDARGIAALRGGDQLKIVLSAAAEPEPRQDKVELLLTIASEPVLAPPQAAYGLWMNDTGNARVSCPRFGWSVLPTRVDLVDPEKDLCAGRVRRIAAFRWSIVVPEWQLAASYFLQRIDHVGATHFPSGDVDFVEASSEFGGDARR